VAFFTREKVGWEGGSGGGSASAFWNVLTGVSLGYLVREGLPWLGEGLAVTGLRSGG